MKVRAGETVDDGEEPTPFEGLKDTCVARIPSRQNEGETSLAPTITRMRLP